MILVNGCSFSTNVGLRDDLREYIWPNMLSEKLKFKVRNLSHYGKSNRLIYRELYSYLIWAKQGKVEMPKIVIMQTTENFRDHVYLYKKSGRFKPNNLESQLDIENWTKLVTHKSVVLNYQSKIMKGLGSSLKSVDFFDKKDGTGITVKQKEELLYDETLREPELRQAQEIISLQALCEKMDLKLCIVPFFGFYSHNVMQDPLYKEINQRQFLLSDLKGGMFDYLINHFFDMTDGYHFNVDGHKFIADAIYNFFKNDVKVVNDYLQTPRKKQAFMPIPAGKADRKFKPLEEAIYFDYT